MGMKWQESAETPGRILRNRFGQTPKSGRFCPKRPAGLLRNWWQESAETGGRFDPKYSVQGGRYAYEETENVNVSIIPADNSVVLQFEKNEVQWCFVDRFSQLEKLRAVLTKWQDWASKLKGSGTAVNKEVGTFFVQVNNPPPYLTYRNITPTQEGNVETTSNYPVNGVFSLATGSDGNYYLEIAFKISAYFAGRYVTGMDNPPTRPETVGGILLSKHQVSDLLALLDESSYPEKAKMVDEVERASNQAAAEKAQKDKSAIDALK